MAKGKKKSDAGAPEAENATTSTTASISKNETREETKLIFGVDPKSSIDIEDQSSVLAPIAKYAILGMICLMSFAIRLFAVVRYESVGYAIR